MVRGSMNTERDDLPLSLVAFQREQDQHERDHDRERMVARETAQRLEREVEETAHRMERQVEDVAARIEKAVDTALRAVAATAMVHAEAHSKEHLAHERIHTVEKDQVEKAEANRRLEDAKLSTDLSRYKHEANEWRDQLREQETKFLRRDEANILFDSIQKDIRGITTAVTELRETVISQFSSATGKSQGLSTTGKIIVSVVAAAAGAVAVVAFLLDNTGP